MRRKRNYRPVLRPGDILTKEGKIIKWDRPSNKANRDFRWLAKITGEVLVGTAGSSKVPRA